MADQLELITHAKAPDIETLKRLRAMAGRAHGPDENLDAEVAKAFAMPGLAPSHSLDDALRLMKATIGKWSDFTLEGYAEDEIDGEFSPEGYFFRLGAEYAPDSDPHEAPNQSTPELAVLRVVLDYHVRWPSVKAKRDAAAERKVQREVFTPATEAEPEDVSDEAEEAPAKVYPKTLEGYVESWADWLDRMDQGQIEDPYDYCDAETKAGISKNYQTCISIMKRQAKALTIMEDLLEAEIGKNPSPRMKALKAAIEAIYSE